MNRKSDARSQKTRTFDIWLFRRDGKMAKKKRRYKKRKKADRIDVQIITLIVLSILMAVLIYTKSGVIGAKLNEILRWANGNNAIRITTWNVCNCHQISM